MATHWQQWALREEGPERKARCPLSHAATSLGPVTVPVTGLVCAGHS